MTDIVWTDRSRIETFQRCNRLRFLEYHEGGLGLAPTKKALPLCVGGSTHVGLEHLLLGESEDAAVAAAVADFSQWRNALAVDLAEESARTPITLATLESQMAATAVDLGVPLDTPEIQALVAVQRNAAAEFDDWLWQEQAALVEGLVRAYARRRLAPLLAEFEVLEVEREGEWLLASLVDHDKIESMASADEPCPDCGSSRHRSCSTELRFMSRPDALLRSRADNSLYLLSFKTAAQWDVRKARDAEHDAQGLSEGVEVEKRLGEWWTQLHTTKIVEDGWGMSYNMREWLSALPAPPRILGIRYEYLLKGSRYADKDLSARFGLNVWAQRSHLVRAYQGPDDGWCWSYDFLKDDGSGSKLYYKSWRPRAVWESMPIRQWIDMLDTSTEAMSAWDSTVGIEPRALGWRSEAQAQGFTTTHPLDDVFPPPLTVYRNEDQARDFIEQIECQEVRIAEAVAEVNSARDDGERRSLLNKLFPQFRKSCEYPSTCSFVSICYGGEDIQNNPLDSGRYKRRIPNHPQEAYNNEKVGPSRVRE